MMIITELYKVSYSSKLFCSVLLYVYKGPGVPRGPITNHSLFMAGSGVVRMRGEPIFTIKIVKLINNSWRKPKEIRGSVFLGFTIYCYVVNLGGGQLQLHWCLCCIRINKWYEIVRFCYQTQGQHIPWTFNLIHWLCLDLELTPSQIYDVT